MSPLSIGSNFTLSWYIEGKILQVELTGNFDIEDALIINAFISHWLQSNSYNLALLINAQGLNTVTNFQAIRSTLTVMDNRRIKGIFVVTKSKLIRLSMLVIFSLAPSVFKLFDTSAESEKYINSKLELLL